MTDFFANQTDMILTVVGVAVAVSIVVTAVVKMWPFIRRVVFVVNDLSGEPERPGVPSRPGIMERLQTLEEQTDQESRSHEMMLDSVNRIETKLEILGQRFDVFTTESMSDRRALWQIATTHHGHDKETHDDESDNT